jgi:hypothetical protein
MFLVSPYSHPPGTLYEAIQRLGITSGLKLCLDAGDISSYDGSSQTWTDRSGGSYSFYRGSGSGSDGADPTFNGTAGNQTSSEYFALDGGDYFTLNQANPSWVTAMHKTGATFTIAEWVRPGTIGAGNYYGYLGDQTSGSPTTGFVFGINAADLGGATGALAAQINNASVSKWLKTSTALVTGSTWNFVAVSLDMGAGTVVMQINGTQESTGSQAFTPSPATGAAAATLQIGATGSGTYPDTAERYGEVGIWQGTALSAAQLSALYEATRSKFGV